MAAEAARISNLQQMNIQYPPAKEAVITRKLCDISITIGVLFIGLFLLVGCATAKKEVELSGNPLFAGWYADPEVIVYGDQYWIFPTYSDHFHSQKHFDCFSSPDLITWTKHERILTQKNCKWIRKALWAPSVVEKDDKYYLFFGANDVRQGQLGGIGVAVADKPEGPYEDLLGEPLIKDIKNGAQPIDQFVFKDGKQWYMVYGGWRHCNIVKLKDDFTGLESFDDGDTFKEITPKGYVEGPVIFKRDKKYYFMWSEGNWTRSDYKVAYAMSDNLLGPYERIETVLQEDATVARGAGHHSVLKLPKKDEWYVVYHRRPLGITWGNHRVTCIDKMEFGDDGKIKPVKITHDGVEARPLNKKYKSKRVENKKDGYVFTSFRENGVNGLHMAYSFDGLEWKALKRDGSFVWPKIGGKLMRDPCIIQGPDKKFHMVWTTSWGDKGIGIAHSEDLINWSEQKFVPVMKHESKARNCWAPEITWDSDEKQYVIYWATTIPGKFSETEKNGDKGYNHRMYYTTTKDFETYNDTKLLYDPGFIVIDSTILKHGDKYIMIAKNETKVPEAAKNLHVATSDKVTGPWQKAGEPFSPKGLWVEGPTAAKVGDEWYIYFDAYQKGRYGVMKTKDFKSWENVPGKLVYPKGMRHGSVLPVSAKILNKLIKAK